jgi:hypothetical protein
MLCKESDYTRKTDYYNMNIKIYTISLLAPRLGRPSVIYTF